MLLLGALQALDKHNTSLVLGLEFQTMGRHANLPKDMLGKWKE